MPCLLPEPARDVVLGALVGRVGEDLVGRIELDQMTCEKEAGILCNTRGLLHVVRHDHDGVLPLQFKDQILDL